jgi:hypothetical protein
MPRGLALLLLSTTLLIGAIASTVPGFEADTLSGTHLTMPQAAQGPVSLLIIGFTHGSNRQTSEWARKTQPLANAHVCEIWSLAVLEQVPRLVRGTAVRGIRRGVPKDQQDHFLVVYKDEKELKEAVGYQKGDDAWLLLFDKTGAILWLYHGPFSEDALSDLRKQIR